jgi:hypothetical protein
MKTLEQICEEGGNFCKTCQAFVEIVERDGNFVCKHCNTQNWKYCPPTGKDTQQKSKIMDNIPEQKGEMYQATVEWQEKKMSFQVWWYDKDGATTRAISHFLVINPEFDKPVPGERFSEYTKRLQKEGLIAKLELCSPRR